MMVTTGTRGGVVIDVGAARYGGDYSMERLIEQFNPEYLYAIDPNEGLQLPEGFDDQYDNTTIVLIQKAAWTHEGFVHYRADGLNSWVTNDTGAPTVPCLDLAGFVDECRRRHDQKLVLKLDCEGSEYDLLPYLINKHADALLDLVIVEWHNTPEAADTREYIEHEIACELQEWPY